MSKSSSINFFPLFLRLFIPLSLLPIAGASFYGHEAIERELTQIRTQDAAYVKLGAGALSDKVEFITHDLAFLSNHSALNIAVNQPTPNNLKHLAEDFAVFSGSREHYDQIRWIDENGMEVVRVDHMHGKTVVVPADKLQNKGQRYFFTDTIKLNPGEVFISPLDLNIEQNKIEEPYKPMIRVATPITDRQGKKRGIIILNYYGKDMLQAFSKATANISDHSMLINNEGYWLKSPTASDEWGFMFKRPEQSMATRSPAAWKRILGTNHGQLELDDGMWTWETVYPLQAGQKTSSGATDAFAPSRRELEYRQYFWKSVTHQPADTLRTIRQAIWLKMAWIAGVLLCLIGLGSWLLARAWELLADAKLKYRTVADYTYNWETWIDPNGHYVYCSPSCARITGRSPDAFMADPNLFLNITHPDDRHRMEMHLQRHTASDAPSEFIIRIVQPDGQVRWLEHACQAVYGETGDFLGRRASNRDVTERMQAEAKLRESEERLKEAQYISHLGSWELDLATGKLEWSDEIFRLFEIDPKNFSATYEGFLNAIHPDDRDAVNSAYSRSLEIREPYEITHRLLMSDGRIKWVTERCHSDFDAEGKPIRSIGTVQDITEQKMTQERIEHMAHYDALTNLPNRALFYDRLRQALSLAKRHEAGLTLLYMDLDGFKQVNDTQGHHAGDLILKNVAERLTQCVRESDTVSRLGGDEFTVILDGMHKQDDVVGIAQKIIQAIAVPFDLEGNEGRIGISIGIARYSEEANDEDELVKQADQAMYKAKSAGKNTYWIGAAD